MARPIRFGATAGPVLDPVGIVEQAVIAEAVGFSSFGVNDHLGSPVAPLIALQAVAGATQTIRLSQAVLNQDFRHPAILAKELATLDVLSGGRVEVALGAGWMRSEYEQIGLRFDPAPERIARLAETVEVLRGLFSGERFTFAGTHLRVTDLSGVPRPVQTPAPPIMIGGGGPKVLAVAAQHADIVQILGSPVARDGVLTLDPASYRAESYEERVAWVRDAAGERFDDLELAIQLLDVTITDDPEQALDALVTRTIAMVQRFGGTVPPDAFHPDRMMELPHLAIGTLDEVCQKLLDVRDRLGFSYFVAPPLAPPKDLPPIIERCAGR